MPWLGPALGGRQSHQRWNLWEVKPLCRPFTTRSRPNDSLRRTGGRKSGRRFSGTSDSWVAAVGHSRSIHSFALPNLLHLQRNTKAQTMTRLVALDTQTTGTTTKEGDRIVEIALFDITLSDSKRYYNTQR